MKTFNLEISDINLDTLTFTDPTSKRTYKLIDWDVKSPAVTYIKAGKEGVSLDQVHFEWTAKGYVNLPLAAEHVPALKDVVTLPNKHEKRENSYCWCVRVDTEGDEVRSHARLMNFRRYSWSISYTKPECGAGGFCNGIVYANKLDGGIACSTTKQVIRETLVGTLASTRIPDGLIQHVAVRPLVQRLLDEALEWDRKDGGVYRCGAHCALHASNGACGDLVVNGEDYKFEYSRA
jgi:hypothetical protein